MKISCQSCGAKYNIADEKVRGKIVKIACKKCGARIEIDGREPAEQAQDNDETRVFDQAVVPPAGAPAADSWTVSIDDNDQRELTTAQLAELYAQGVVTPDTFVWRDGMPDWQAVRDVAALQGVLASSAPAPAPAYSEPPTAAYPQPSYDPPAPSYDPPAPIAAAAASYGSPQIETSQPARLGGSRRGGAVDLFAQSAAPAEDEDVATSAPAGAAFGGMPSEAMDHGKPLGARNENSVLFSLSALTASGPAPAATGAPADDEKSGLIDIQKLAAAAKTNGVKDDRAKLDDIMNLGGGGAFGSALGAPILAPPPATALTESAADAADGKKGGNKGLLIAVAALGAVVVALVLVLVLKKGGDDEVAAKDKGGKVTEEPSSKDKATKDKPETKDPPKDEKVATPEPTTTAAPEAPADPAGGPIGKAGAPTTKGDPGATAKGTTTGAAPAPTDKTPPTTSPTTKCTSLDCMMGAKDPPKKEEPKPAPAAGGGEIDKAAVKSALGGVPYKDCGSGGAGKVQVTFGPNGKVTSASVTSGNYDGATKSCIAGRFKSAKVPAYGGDPKSFAWSINL